MRLIIQRVNKAQVSVEEQVVGRIEKGLFVLVGFKKGDNEKVVEVLLEKLIKLRVMADEYQKMNLNLVSAGAELLVVSQFTLYANTKGGNRPSFIEAEQPKIAHSLYNYFIAKLKERNISVATGRFGEYMKINLELDGPVTIILNHD